METKELTYVELLSVKNGHIAQLQQRRDFLHSAIGSLALPSRASMSIAFLSELLDDVILDVCFEVHRMIRTDHPTCHICRQPCEATGGVDRTTAAAGPGDAPAIECDHCHNQRVAAVRYAPHLEKCMGLGRTSSRSVLRRSAQANNNAANNSTASLQLIDSEADGGALDGGEDDDDDDFIDGQAGNKKRRKVPKGKASAVPKKAKRDVAAASSPDTLSAASKSPQGKKAAARVSAGTPADPEATMRRFAAALVGSKSQAELRQLFEQCCGVLSSSTGKPCNKSVRCSIHTDEQRNLVRSYCLQADYHPTTLAASDSDAGAPSITSTGDYDLFPAAADYAHGGDPVSPSTLAEVNEYIDIESDGEAS